jgi:hypothetical protein
VHLADRSANRRGAGCDAAEYRPAGFDSLNGSPFKVRLDSGLGKQGKINADGEVNLAPVTAQLNVKTQDIDLRRAVLHQPVHSPGTAQRHARQ